MLLEQEVDINKCKASRPEDQKMILAKAKACFDIDVINRKINNTIKEIVEETERTIRREEKTKILLIGNNGVGKSTLLTAMIGNDAVKRGEHEYEDNERVFMELSGLANSRALKKVAMAMTSALKQNGRYKILFIVTLEAGRIKPDDTETIASVLNAASIEGNYTTIINKSSTKVVNHLREKNDAEKNDLLHLRLPNESVGHIECIPRSECKDKVFSRFVRNVLDNAPTLSIKNGKVTNINTETKEDEYKNSKKHQIELLHKVGERILDLQTNSDRGLSMAREALVLSDELYGRKSVHAAESLVLVSEGLNYAEKYDEVLKTAQEALEYFLSIYDGREHENVANALYQIGCALRGMGKKDEALKMHREALSIKEAIFGKESMKTTNARANIAYLLDDGDEKLELEKLNLSIEQNVLGNDHPLTATSMNNIGGAYYNKGEYGKALEMLELVLIIREKVLGNDHPHTKNTRQFIANCKRRLSDDDSSSDDSEIDSSDDSSSDNETNT